MNKPQIDPPTILASGRTELSISDALLRFQQRGRLQDLRITGVVNRLHVTAGGLTHFFRLQDDGGEMEAVIRMRNRSSLPASLRDGDRVRVHGTIERYRNRHVQIDVRAIEVLESLAPSAAPQLLPDRSRARSAGRKRLPEWPRRIGIITSPNGVGIEDVAAIVQERAPWIKLVLAPTPVQGDKAADAITAALARFQRGEGRVDLVVVCRGGGYAEDFAVFNARPVVEAIATASLPVITAIGHARDHTAADEVAAVSAATPSVAAVHATPDRRVLQERLRSLAERAHRAMRPVNNANETVSTRVKPRLEALLECLGTDHSEPVSNLTDLAPHEYLWCPDEGPGISQEVYGAKTEIAGRHVRAAMLESAMVRVPEIVRRMEDEDLTPDERVRSIEDVQAHLSVAAMLLEQRPCPVEELLPVPSRR